MTISKKLWSIVFVMIASLGIMTMSSQWLSRQVSEANHHLEIEMRRVFFAGNLSENVQDIALAAMDIIVDSAAGTVDNDLKQEIKSSHEELTSGYAEFASFFDHDDAVKNKVGDLQARTEKLVSIVTDQLYKAVEQKAVPETFSRLDNQIDSLAASIVSDLKNIKDGRIKAFENTEVEAAQENERNSQSSIIILVLSTLVSLGLSWAAIKSIITPLHGIREDIQSIADGNDHLKIRGLARKDEIGQIAMALDVLRKKVEESFSLKQMIDEMPLNIVTADVRNEFKVNYANRATTSTLAKLQRYLPINANELVGNSIDVFHKDPGRIRRLLEDPKNLPHQAKIKLGEETLDLKVSAIRDKSSQYVGAMLTWSIVTQNVELANTFEESIGAVSSQISSTAESLNQGAVSLQGAIEELSASAMEISKRVHDSLTVARTASDKGLEAQQSMEFLSQSAEKVSNVVTFIQQIAEKTNLLALNATIESARAGEAGKGFAVVANEVKALANQTSEAMSDISKQVEDMRNSADLAVNMVKDISHSLQSVNQFASDVAAAVEQQQASTSEIAQNISGSAASHRGGSSGGPSSVLVLSSELTQVSNDLKSECDSFLEKVRKM